MNDERKRETREQPASGAAEAAPADGAVASGATDLSVESPAAREREGGPLVRPRTPGVTFRLPRFEGPLDLLLHLLKRDEVDIHDIPISHITRQYLEYIELMRMLDLEVAGEFLVMAATLMRIKAKMLLPLPSSSDEEEEGDPREELVQRLVEYRQFKEAAGTLKLREEDRRQLFERGMIPGDDEMGPLPLAPATLFDLLDALNRVMSRIPAPPVTYDVQGELYDDDDKMSLIASTVAEHGSVSFVDLLLRCRVRAEMVVTFMALLELIKLGTVLVVQTENFGDITILARTPEGPESHAPVESSSGA